MSILLAGPSKEKGQTMRMSLLLLPVAFAAVALAQTSMPEPKTAIVPRMDAQVKIDGVLDEQPWQKAARLTPFGRNDATTPARHTSTSRAARISVRSSSP